MQFLSQEQKGALYAIISGLCYGLLGYFGVSLMNQDLSVYNILGWRFLVSSVCMLLFVLPHYETIFQRPQEILHVLIAGALFYSASSIFYFIACRYIGTGLSMVTFFTYPAFVMFLQWLFYRKKITKVYHLAVAIFIIGMAFLVDFSDATFDIFGLSISVIGALSYACYVVISKKNKLSPLVSTLMVSVGCMMTCFLGAFSENTFVIPTGFSVWMYILALGILCTALPILLLLEGLKYISAEKASLLSVLEPVFVVIFGICLLNETLSSKQCIGMAIIMCGGILTLFSHKINLDKVILRCLKIFSKKKK